MSEGNGGSAALWLMALPGVLACILAGWLVLAHHGLSERVERAEYNLKNAELRCKALEAEMWPLE